jgi:hypothetical protein
MKEKETTFDDLYESILLEAIFRMSPDMKARQKQVTSDLKSRGFKNPKEKVVETETLSFPNANYEVYLLYSKRDVNRGYQIAFQREGYSAMTDMNKKVPGRMPPMSLVPKVMNLIKSWFKKHKMDKILIGSDDPAKVDFYRKIFPRYFRTKERSDDSFYILP